ncbi:MAG: hypothetical protein HY903_04325 [Deltaproteobacteria bacterium]|nr:hypothetical protein [Deltaproteobacteria bacterium]
MLVPLAVLTAVPAMAQDRTGLGEGEVDRVKLGMVSDLSELSLDEALGVDAPLHFSLYLFGDAGVTDELRGPTRVLPSFALGPIGLLASGAVGSGVKALSELVLESDDAGVIHLEVERLHLRWSGEYLSVTAGRVHTPIGYWNPAFHHGNFIQPTILRPRFVAFEDEGGLIPAHAVGVFGGAMLPVATGSLQLDLGVANGRGGTADDVRILEDTNDAKSIVVRVAAADLGVTDLQAGAGALVDRIAAEPAAIRPALPDVAIDEAVVNLFAAYTGPSLTVIAEAYYLLHRAQSRRWIHLDAFALVAYRFERLTPYLRVEWSEDRGGPDPFFSPAVATVADAPADRRGEGVVGLRFETGAWNAIKLEYRPRAALPRGRVIHALEATWAFEI